MLMKFSVIVPVWNAEKYLQTCLDSLCRQTFADFECLCVDDGSTDGSLRIIESFASKDSRFKVYYQENRGVGAARNVGLSNAQGEMVLFLDADDAYVDNALESIWQSISCESLDLLMFGFEEVSTIVQSDGPKSISKPAVYNLLDSDAASSAFGKIGMLVAWNACFKKELIKEIRFSSIPISEDSLFAVKAFVSATRFGCISSVLYQYRQHPGSSMHTNNLQSVLAIVEGLEYYIDAVRSWKYFGRVRGSLKKKIRTTIGGQIYARLMMLNKQDRDIAEHFLFDRAAIMTTDFFFYNWLFAGNHRMMFVVFLRWQHKLRVALLRLQPIRFLKTILTRKQ